MNKPLNALADAGEKVGGRKTVRSGDKRAVFNLLLDPGHPDLEELIQIGTGNRKELNPFEERISGVTGFFKNPLIEFKPTKIPVGIKLRSG
ncbi:MAG: hypothetical protein OHK005_14330 [Candidatus Methylacidiphilales bacterium]